MGPCTIVVSSPRNANPRNQANDKKAAARPNSRRTNTADYLAHITLLSVGSLLWLLIDEAQFSCKLKRFLKSSCRTRMQLCGVKKITTP